MALTPSVCRVSSGFFCFFFWSLCHRIVPPLSKPRCDVNTTELYQLVDSCYNLWELLRRHFLSGFLRFFFFFFVWTTELYFMSCIFQSEIIIESREKWNASLYCTYQLKIIYLIQSVEQTAASLIPMATYMKKTGKKTTKLVVQDKYLETIKYIYKIFMWKFESNIILAFN